MNDLEIGKIVSEDRGRDAIHIAVAPAVATCSLSPGQHVNVVDGEMAVPSGGGALGIVDPFLKMNVIEGQRFWVFLYPNTITSLRHDWVHPSFPGGSAGASGASGASGVSLEVEKSRAWIEAFANDELDQTYSRLMEAATLWLEYEEYTYDNTERYKDIKHEKWEIFWKHYEIVKNVKVSGKDRFFTCSC